jgi:putative ABC transport system permease protein
MARLAAREGDPLTIDYADGKQLTRVAGARLEAGGGGDDAWWIPLAEAQALAGLEGRVSLVQVRIEGGTTEAAAAVAALERGGGVRALVLHALSTTEAGLLVRMRRLMTLVTVAALVAAGLCAFGTLTDLALERRREIALVKALGASARDVVRQFAAESLAIGLAGGIAGWLIGLFFAEVIGRTVFHSAIAVHWNVPPIVLGLALLVSGVAGLGPIRLALAVEPAPTLKGE